MSDPLRTWWDALERGGCGPHGAAHDYRARCPLHGGDNREALHVFPGVDGRAVPHCFACKAHPKDIALAVGIDPRDSFPAGHVSARRRPLADVPRAEFEGNARLAANALAAGERLDGPDWRFELTIDCPACGCQFAQLVVSRRRDPFVHCRNECGVKAFTGGLAQLVTETRRTQ